MFEPKSFHFLAKKSMSNPSIIYTHTPYLNLKFTFDVISQEKQNSLCSLTVNISEYNNNKEDQIDFNIVIFYGKIYCTDNILSSQYFKVVKSRLGSS